MKSVVMGAREVRKLTPPNLDAQHLGERIICYRPAREGSPKMAVETIGSKVVFHNYGHCGSGWSLAPGCTQYVVKLFEEHYITHQRVPADTQVTVVGAGVIGLFTAYNLLEKGCKVTVVAESYKNLPSYSAGGLLSMMSLENFPAADRFLITQIALDSYAFYKAVAQNSQGAPFLGGAHILPAYFMNREESGLELYVGKVMQSGKDVVVDFGNGTTRELVGYDDSIFIDTACLMDLLMVHLQKEGVHFQQKRIESFDALAGTYIFNCTGLGSQTLCSDSSMSSIQGHLIMLKDQNPEALRYMISYYSSIHNGTTETGQQAERYCDTYPKQLLGARKEDVGVIGGTYIYGATPATPNVAEFEKVIEAAKDFYGITS